MPAQLHSPIWLIIGGPEAGNISSGAEHDIWWADTVSFIVPTSGKLQTTGARKLGPQRGQPTQHLAQVSAGSQPLHTQAVCPGLGSGGHQSSQQPPSAEGRKQTCRFCEPLLGFVTPLLAHSIPLFITLMSQALFKITHQDTVHTEGSL